MKLTPEMKEMLEVIKSNDSALKNLIYRSYIVPDISDKILKKLIKHYDSNIAINAVLAFYDTSSFGSGKDGYIFTSDGLYHKLPIVKADYVNYKDISEIYYDEKEKAIHINTNSEIKIKIYTNKEFAEALKDTLEKLIKIDKFYGQTTFKESGTIQKIPVPPEMLKECKKIIHTASASAAGVGTGLAQLPGTDAAALMIIQIGMMGLLGKVFDLHISESGCKALIANYGAAHAGRAVSQFLVGWIPGVGNAINATTAAGITELMGWMAVNDFHQRWIEDKNKGKLDGMKAGYVQASSVYEQKLNEQAEKFLKQEKIFKKQKEEYDILVKDYEEYIKDLKGKVVESKTLAEYERLKAMQKEV